MNITTREIFPVGTSDGSGSTRYRKEDYFPFTVSIEKMGYETINMVIDEFITPKDMNIVLNKTGTKIYNSTIYNSNIY